MSVCDYLLCFLVFSFGFGLSFYYSKNHCINTDIQKNECSKFDNLSNSSLELIANEQDILELSNILSLKAFEGFEHNNYIHYNGVVSLLSALIGYMKDACLTEEFTFSTLATLIDCMEVQEDYYGYGFKNAVDLLFEESELEYPCCFYIKQYNLFNKLHTKEKKDVIFLTNLVVNKMLISFGISCELVKPELVKPELVKPELSKIIDLSCYIQQKEFVESIQSTEPTQQESNETKEVTFAIEEVIEEKLPNLLPTKEEIKKAIAQLSINGMDLEILSPELQDNEEVVLQAINGYGWAFKYASDRLKNDKDVVFTAVSNYAYALQWASDELRDDKEIVLKALETNGYALAYASPRLRDNGDVIKKALDEKGRALRFASLRLRSNKDIVDYALTTSKRAKDFSLL